MPRRIRGHRGSKTNPTLKSRPALPSHSCRRTHTHPAAPRACSPKDAPTPVPTSRASCLSTFALPFCTTSYLHDNSCLNNNSCLNYILQLLRTGLLELRLPSILVEAKGHVWKSRANLLFPSLWHPEEALPGAGMVPTQARGSRACTRQDRTARDKTRTAQHTTRQDRTAQDRTGQHSARPDRTG